MIGVAAIAGDAQRWSCACADARHDDNRPPQTLPQGFESIEQLQRDAKAAQNEPLYSAWLVESSRFVNVPFGSFMPDRDFINPTTPNHDIQFIDFPANVGIIKGSDGGHYALRHRLEATGVHLRLEHRPAAGGTCVSR